MPDKAPPAWRVVAANAGVVLYIVAAYLALALAISFGLLGVAVLMDRFHAAAAGLVSAEQALNLWRAAWVASGASLIAAVWRISEWLGYVVSTGGVPRQAPRPRPRPVPEHEIRKTGPNRDEIERRGGLRGP